MALYSDPSPIAPRVRPLVPQLILEGAARGESAGRFPAAGLFLDISGFTHLTEGLMAHGPRGAEVLAEVVEAVFAPLVDMVFAHGGFVAGFHGDAFTALFSAPPGGEAASAWSALAAAWRMRDRLAELAVQNTPFGAFRLAAKIGLAIGEAEWDILAADGGRRALYCFRGTAVIDCAHAENQAEQNDIVLTRTLLQLVADRVTVEVRQGYARLTGIVAPLPPSHRPDAPSPSPAALASFLPAAVLDFPLRGEFRRVIALFVNLQGMPTFDELLAFSELCFALQQTYGGLFHRIMFDDKGCNLQLFWGAPTSQEKDLARALSFVLALRDGSKLAIRAGLTHRMAFAGFVGSSLYEEYTCYSRGVNLAARLMGAAEWGEIHVSPDVAEGAAGQYRTEYLGERSFKGIAAPQAVYRLLGPEASSRPAFYAGRLVGREPELHQLAGNVAPLLDGRFAGVTTLVGEPGSGKSRLAHAFLANLANSNPCTVLRCQSDEILRQPLNPFRYALRQTFEQVSSGDQTANRTRFEQLLGELTEATADPDLRAELNRTRSFLGSLVDLHWPDSPYEQAEPQLRVQNTFEALKTLLLAESRRRPLIVLLEDIHVLDSSSRNFLAHLSHDIADYPIAILATSREEPDPTLFDPSASQQTIRLGPLVADEVKAMIEVLVGEPPPPALVDRIAAETGGNPLFVEQLLEYLRNNQLLERYTQARAAFGEPELYLPTDVRSLLVARIDQLPAALKTTAQVASVLGREFSATVLSAMLPTPSGLDTTLALGIDDGLWYPLENDRYLFHHALLRDAAYDMQLTTRRHDLHALAAGALAADNDSPSAPRLAEIAYHYDRADAADAAGHYYGRAGERAAKDYFNDQALAYYSRALELTAPDNGDAIYPLLMGREAIYGLMGRRQEQAADLDALEALPEPAARPDRQAAIRLQRAAYALALGDYAAAIDHAERAAAIGAHSGDALSELTAHQRIGRALWQQGRAIEAEPHLRKALDLARAGQHRAQEAECLYDLAVSFQYRGHQRQAYDYALEAQESFQLLDNRPGVVRCLNLIATIFYSTGDFAESLKAIVEALSMTHEIGWRYAEAGLLLNLGSTHFELGSFDLAHQVFQQAVNVSRQIGDRERESVALDTLGLIEHYKGQPELARQHYEAALVLAEGIKNERNSGYTLTHLGFTLLELGQPAAAADSFEQALNYRRRQGSEASVIDTITGLAAAAAARGRLDEAGQYVSRILAWIDANGTNGLELPVQTYLICYDILRRAAPADAEAARRVLEQGHVLLQQRANQINDADLRRQFLEQVPYNRQFHDAWLAANEALSAGGSATQPAADRSP